MKTYLIFLFHVSAFQSSIFFVRHRKLFQNASLLLSECLLLSAQNSFLLQIDRKILFKRFWVVWFYQLLPYFYLYCRINCFNCKKTSIIFSTLEIFEIIIKVDTNVQSGLFTRFLINASTATVLKDKFREITNIMFKLQFVKW